MTKIRVDLWRFYLAGFITAFVVEVIKGRNIYGSIGYSIVTGLIYALALWILWQLIKGIAIFFEEMNKK